MPATPPVTTKVIETVETTAIVETVEIVETTAIVENTAKPEIQEATKDVQNEVDTIKTEVTEKVTNTDLPVAPTVKVSSKEVETVEVVESLVQKPTI